MNPQQQDQLIAQVNVKLQELRDQGYDNCLFELFRPRITQFYSKTTDPSQVAACLLQLCVLTMAQRDQINVRALDVDKNEFIYGIVFRKEAVTEIIRALAMTENNHILEIIEEISQTNPLR